MVAMRDPETQKNGVVFILYNVGNTRVLGGDRAEKLAQVLWLLPVCIKAAHYCYDDPKLEIFEKTMSTAMESYYLCRFRSHVGTFSIKAVVLLWRSATYVDLYSMTHQSSQSSFFVSFK